MYLHYGLEAFSKLNGMFACAFWDQERERLVLLRDRIGKKPLYYYLDSERLVFGSELKSLLAYGNIERRLCLTALQEYLGHGYVVGQNCILAGVRRLPPGHYLDFRNGDARCRPYWSLRFADTDERCDEREAAERVEDLISQAARQRLISDVPLGAFLSGGLDSSVVVAPLAPGTRAGDGEDRRGTR